MTDQTELPPLLWIDVETTGLIPEENLLLEVAAVVTDSDLNPLYEKNWVVEQEIVLSAIGDFALKTHTTNGLLAEVVQHGKPLQLVEDDLNRMMNRSDIFPLYPVGDSKPPLCGSTINFERGWLSYYMPNFYDKIHYRSIDVSSVKELMQRWMPSEAISRRETSKHRALYDIRDSIDELRHYRNVLGWNAPLVLH